MEIFYALIIGILTYFVAHLVFNDPISMLLAILAALSVGFGTGYWGRKL